MSLSVLIPILLLLGFLYLDDPVSKYVVPRYSLPPFLHSVTLPDGRRMAYAEHGPSDGFPVFVLQSFMQARVGHNPELLVIDQKQNARIILVDRPGYGESDSAPSGYKSTHFAHDLDFMAETMGLSEYGLVGISAGAVYAMAAAHELSPKRLKVVVLLSPAPPDPNQGDPGEACVHSVLDPLRQLGYHVPQATRLAMLGLRWWIFFWYPELAFPPDQMWWAFAPNELSHFIQTGVWDTFCNATLEAFKSGVDGIVNDVNQISVNWSFQVSDLNKPNRKHNILIFHGLKDTIVPVGCAHHYKEKIPQVTKMVLYEDCGHGMMANVTVWNDVLTHINQYKSN